MSVKPPIPRRFVPPPPVPGTTAARPNIVQTPPPPPPRRKQTASEQPPQEIDLAKLLARRPPPPPLPTRQSSQTSTPNGNAPNGRRLPPPPQALPPPPPINLSSKPAVAPRDAVQFDETALANSLSLSCFQCKDFSVVDEHAALFPRDTVHSLEDLALSLTEPFDNDADKARALFTWLHLNIIYDVDGFFSGNLKPATAESTLLSGLAVCEGFAVLFEHLADCIGLQCHKVSGHGKGYGYKALLADEPVPEQSMNHAWNCIMLGEEWHLIDACWGAGHLTNEGVWEVKLNPIWFIASSVEFGQRHFPEDNSFQLTSEETTWEEYITAPPGPTLTSDFTNYGLDPLRVEPAFNEILEKRRTKFSISKRCEHMSTAEADNYVLVLSIDKEFIPLAFDDQEGAWTTTAFTPRNGTLMLCAVDTVNGKDAKGLGLVGFGKTKGKKAMTFKGLATWTVLHL